MLEFAARWAGFHGASNWHLPSRRALTTMARAAVSMGFAGNGSNLMLATINEDAEALELHWHSTRRRLTANY